MTLALDYSHLYTVVASASNHGTSQAGFSQANYGSAHYDSDDDATASAHESNDLP